MVDLFAEGSELGDILVTLCDDGEEVDGCLVFAGKLVGMAVLIFLLGFDVGLTVSLGASVVFVDGTKVGG